MKFFGVFIALVVVLGYAPAQSAKGYIWTDENGVKHYSNVAPAESADGVKNDDESKTDPSATEKPRNAHEDAKQKPNTPAAETDAGKGVEPTGDEKIAPEKKTPDQDAQTPPDNGLKMEPLTQDERVKREKAHVKQLQIELAKDDSKRTKFIAGEKKRLLRELERLRRAPVAQFGSPKNKSQQMGYYQYRLDALVNNPETYFDYGDSDTD